MKTKYFVNGYETDMLMFNKTIEAFQEEKKTVATVEYKVQGETAYIIAVDMPQLF